MNTGIIARNSLWITLDAIAGFGSTLIASVIVARALGPRVMGEYNFLLWLVNTAGLLASVGIPAATRKFVAEHFGRGDMAGAASIVKATLRVQLALSSLVVACGIALVLSTVPAEQRLYTSLAVMSLMPAMLLGIPSQALAAVQNFSGVLVASTASAALNVVGVVLSITMGWGLAGLAGSLLTSRCVDYGLRLLYFRTQFPALASNNGQLSPELRQRLVRFCSHCALLTLLDVAVWSRSEMIFLRAFCDVRQVAFFSLGFYVVQHLLLLPRSLASAAGVAAMARQGDDASAAARLTATAVRVISVLGFPLLIGMAALAAPAIGLLYGGQFGDAVPVVVIVALMSIPKLFLLSAQQLLHAVERQDFLVKWGSGCALFNVAAAAVLVPRWGAVGAALSNGIAQAIAVGGIWFFTWRTCRVPLDGSALLKVLLSAAGMGAVVAATTRSLNPLPALVAGILLGVSVFAVLLRIGRAFDGADRTRFVALQQQLPPIIRPWYMAGLDFLGCGLRAGYLSR